METVRLRRPAVACIECRRRKVRCNRGHPCQRCSHSLLLCSYASRPNSSNSSFRLPSPTGATFQPLPSPFARPPSRTGLGMSFSPNRGQGAGNPNGNPSASVHQQTMLSSSIATSSRDRLPESAVSESSSSLLPGPHVHLIDAGDGLDRPQCWRAVLSQLAKASLASSVCNDFGRDVSAPGVEGLQKQLARLAHSEEKLQRKLYQLCTWESSHEHPSRQMYDELVKTYLLTFENIFRVVHIPSFRTQYQQYWATSDNSSTHDLHYILPLVSTIGACIQNSSIDQESSLRTLALRSILNAQKWIIASCEGSNITMATLQTFCLVLIAQQTIGLPSTAVSLSIDALVRAAMRLDLHRPQPTAGSALSDADVQLRKKLWCTVVELSIQSSLDAGLPPSLLPADLQFQLPLNIDDAKISQCSSRPLDASNITDTTLQILLARTANTRLRIVHHLYGFGSIDSYDTILELGHELSDQYRANSKILVELSSHSRGSATAVGITFQMKLLNALTLGPLMALHSPFAYFERYSPKFYFSRKVCFEAAWSLVSRPLPQQAQTAGSPNGDMYGVLLLYASGLFERIQSQSTSIISLEMLTSFTEQSFLSNPLLNSEMIFEAIQQSVDLCARRLEKGSTDVAALVIFSCALSHIRALDSKSDPHKSVAEEAARSLEEWLEILERTAKRGESPASIAIEHVGDDLAMGHDLNPLNEDWLTMVSSSSLWDSEDTSGLQDTGYQLTRPLAGGATTMELLGA